MTRVVITEAAWSDILDIGRNIALDNISAAHRLLDGFHDKCRSLGERLEAFPLVEGYEHKGIRRRVHGNYLIFYRTGNGLTEVLRILHGARDYEAIL